MIVRHYSVQPSDASRIVFNIPQSTDVGYSKIGDSPIHDVFGACCIDDTRHAEQSTASHSFNDGRVLYSFLFVT